MKIGTRTVGVSIGHPKYRINVNTLEHVAATTLEINEIGVCNLNLDRPIAFDPYVENRDMRVLLERAGRVCSRALLTDAGWPRGPANERILDTYVRRLRAKIPEFGVEINTVRKRGFLLDVVGAAV